MWCFSHRVINSPFPLSHPDIFYHLLYIIKCNRKMKKSSHFSNKYCLVMSHRTCDHKSIDKSTTYIIWEMYSLCTILYSIQRWQTSSTTQLKLRTRTLQALEIMQVKTKQRTFVSFLCWTNFGELYDPLLILIIHYTVHILLYGQDIVTLYEAICV